MNNQPNKKAKKAAEVPTSLPMSTYAEMLTAQLTLSLQPQIDKEVAALLPKLQQIRRHLHHHAELSFQEVSTAAYITQQLQVTITCPTSRPHTSCK